MFVQNIIIESLIWYYLQSYKVTKTFLSIKCATQNKSGTNVLILKEAKSKKKTLWQKMQGTMRMVDVEQRDAAFQDLWRTIWKLETSFCCVFLGWGKPYPQCIYIHMLEWVHGVQVFCWFVWFVEICADVIMTSSQLQLILCTFSSRTSAQTATRTPNARDVTLHDMAPLQRSEEQQSRYSGPLFVVQSGKHNRVMA